MVWWKIEVGRNIRSSRMNLAKGIALPREMPATSAMMHSTSSMRRPAEPGAEGLRQAVDELGGTGGHGAS